MSNAPKRSLVKSSFPWIGGIFFVAVFSYLFSVVPMGKLLLLLRELSKEGLIAFIILSLTGSVLRAWRYQLVLSWAGHAVATTPLFFVTLVRNLCADLLPARLGSTVYIYLVHAKLGIPLASATSSFSLALLFDLVTVPIILIAFIAFDTQLNHHLLLWVILIAALFASGLLIWFLPKILTRAQTIVSASKRKLCVRLNAFFEEVSREIHTLHQPSEFFKLLLLSLFIRLTKYLSLIIFLYALLLPLGITREQLSIVKAFVGILSSEVAASLPVSGIAGFGLYEGTWAFTFRLLGLKSEAADITALSHHLFTQAYGYSLGALALLPLFWLSERSFRKVPTKVRSSTVLRMLIVSSLIFFAVSIAKSGADTAEQPAHPVTAGTYSTSNLPSGGGVIFDSNRSGTFGIYFLGENSTQPVALYDSNAHEMYPDVSPSGDELVFASSKTTKRLEPGSIWLLPRTEDATPRKLIEDGTFPTFIDDSGDILFERHRESVFVFDRATEKEVMVFPTAAFKGFRNSQIVKPRMTRDRRYLTFTSDRPKAWHAWIVDFKEQTARPISPGCEPATAPDGTFGVFIEEQHAIGGSGIYSFDLRSNQIASFHDPKSEFNHEYFPSIDQSGNWVTFSACRENEHSHTSAGYDLFLLPRETPDKVVRLTNDLATNRWPKLTTKSWKASS
ncbi:MAG: flippase-like domain-containing protein [Bdellovibrionales bacterium]|nr:flippase-like domain-containing protein [Bdellovibrionales bacterium]